MLITRTPFRITLGGGGTDLPGYYSKHGGFVLAAAVNKYMFIYLNTPIVDDLVRVKYSKSEMVSVADSRSGGTSPGVRAGRETVRWTIPLR